MALSLFLATKTYVGDPIDCFVPKEFADNWVKYADNYCWVSDQWVGEEWQFSGKSNSEKIVENFNKI